MSIKHIDAPYCVEVLTAMGDLEVSFVVTDAGFNGIWVDLDIEDPSQRAIAMSYATMAGWDPDSNGDSKYSITFFNPAYR